jgi:ribosomal protein L7/L12
MGGTVSLAVVAGALFVLVVALFGYLLGGASDSSEPSPVETALRAGRRVEAIRLYRQQYGVGSQEAQDAIEAMERERRRARRR